MKNRVRNWVREIRQIISLLRKSAQLRGIKAKLQALLYLSIERDNKAGHRIRRWIQPLHEAWIKPVDGLISLQLQLAGNSRRLFLRKGNFGDYQVVGELLDGAYRPPSFIPQVVYDCGANIGVFSLYAATCFPSSKIICFEPDKDNLALLRKNLATNGIAADIREAGVWYKKCILYYHPGRSSIEGITNEEPSPFPIPAECLEIKNADVWVKLDVEGAEYQVLPILLRSQPLPRYLSIELHFFHTRGQEIVNLLKTSGYRLHGYLNQECICAVFDAELA
jgi:FkbM family methyltransferase